MDVVDHRVCHARIAKRRIEFMRHASDQRAQALELFGLQKVILRLFQLVQCLRQGFVAFGKFRIVRAATALRVRC